MKLHIRTSGLVLGIGLPTVCAIVALVLMSQSKPTAVNAQPRPDTVSATVQQAAPAPVSQPRPATVNAAADQDEELITALSANRPDWAPLPIFRGHTEAEPVLEKMLESQDALSRMQSAFLLGQIEDRASIPLLTKHLHDTDPNVRVQCGIALGCMGDSTGLSQCKQVLHASPEWIRYYAVYSLWCMNSARARELLKSASETDSQLVSDEIEGAISTPFQAPPASAAPTGTVTPRPDLTPSQICKMSSDALFEEGDWWFDHGNYDQMIRCLEASLLLEPKDVEAYSDIGYYQWSMGRESKSVETYNRAIAAMPDNPETYFDLGLHYFMTKRYADGEPLFKKAVDMSNGIVLYRKEYAHCLEKLGKLDDALKQWNILADANPKDGSIITNRNRVAKLVQH